VLSELFQDLLHPSVPVFDALFQFDLELISADRPVNVIVTASLDALRLPKAHPAAHQLLQGPINRGPIPPDYVGEFIRPSGPRIVQAIEHLYFELVQGKGTLDEVLAVRNTVYHFFREHFTTTVL
jgi:hypothetical protein